MNDTMLMQVANTAGDADQKLPGVLWWHWVSWSVSSQSCAQVPPTAQGVAQMRGLHGPVLCYGNWPQHMVVIRQDHAHAVLVRQKLLTSNTSHLDGQLVPHARHVRFENLRADNTGVPKPHPDSNASMLRGEPVTDSKSC